MGQIADAAKNPNTFAADPSGFNGSEWATRFAGAGLKGLGQGMGSMQQQKPQGQGPMPVPMPQQPQIQLPGANPPNPSDPDKLRNPFFGQ